ncbi:MAG: UvrD-helicase domain-containing protein [Chloroflexota bacterium]
MTQATDFRPEDARARAIISEALNETLFVEAGAGTGKTRALVDRIVALVCEGVAIEKIAAITFTERAAAELRERVRTGLEEMMRTDQSKTTVIQAALDSLDRAQISTIHAFCQAIVRTYAPEAGVDPDFDVQDAVMTGRRMEERWRRYLERLGADKDACTEIDRLLSLGLKTDELEKLALGLASRGELAEILEANPLVAPMPAWPDLGDLKRQLIATGYEDVDVNDSLRKRIAGVLGALDAILARPDEEREELLAAGAGALIDLHKGADGAWGGRANKEAATAKLEVVEKALCQLLRGLRASALAAVMPRLLLFVRADEIARGRDGTLTFDDLILRARRLLVAGGDAIASLRHRYQALLIDEFQDTDPLQVQIATAFATDPSNGKIEPGRLFLVGDPKQSIYRFRRADMATYAHTAEMMREAGASFPSLALNQRSRGVILDWVNAVFEKMIDGGGYPPEVQPPYAAIHTERDAQLNGPGVATIGGETKENARVLRGIEAGQIAALCRKAIAGGWQVQERDGTVRAAAYKDIAILIPRRTGLVALERALASAAVPYRVESGSLIYKTQEVRDLLNCLTAVDDPADEVAIVGALRSPAFACSDVDLARHRAAGGRFNYYHRDLESWDGPVSDGLRALGEFHRARHNTSLAALVEHFVFARGTIETGVLDQRDRNSFRRARFMIERARTFEAAGPESLRAFVVWMEGQADAAILDNEGAAVDDDEDAVRILTIHGAKGLEFPIVFLSGLSAAQRFDPNMYSADLEGQRVAIYVGTKKGNRQFVLGDFEDLNATEKQHLEAEFDRTMYVGTTRARDHLIISLYHGTRAGACAAKRLIDCGALNGAGRIEVADVATQTQGSALDGLTVEVPAGLAAANFAEQREALLKRAKTRDYTSATRMISFAKKTVDDDTEPWSRGRGGTRLGRAVHAAIQSLPLDANDATIAAFAKAQAVAEAIPYREADVARLVGWIVRESDTWRRARAAKRVMREVPFALESDGSVLEGYIDLVLQTDDGIEIVDWKTDQITPGEIEGRKANYRLQAGLYVYGLETATGQRVSKVTYVFASAGVEEPMGDPAELSAEAQAALAAARVA